MKKLLIFGVCLFVFGFYLSFESINITQKEIQGIMLGQGAVFILWGIKEIISSLLKKGEKNE